MSASVDGTIRILSPKAGQEPGVLQGDGAAFVTLACHPSRRLLAAVDARSKVWVWDLGAKPPRQCLAASLFAGTGGVRSLAFSRDAGYLFTGNGNGTIFCLRLRR